MIPNGGSSNDEYTALIGTHDILIEESTDLREAVGCLCLAPCFPLTVLLSPASLQCATKLASLANTTVEPTPDQITMLDAYARVILPELPDAPIPFPDDLWLRCGFQSKNPWTDFRGGGELAVKTFTWFAQHHAENLSLIAADLDISSECLVADLLENKKYYPYSASFINVIFIIYNYCRIGTDLAGAMTGATGLLKDNTVVVSKHQGSKINVMRLLAVFAQDNESSEWFAPFGEIATFCCIKVHHEWLKLVASGNGANLLDFEKVLNKLPIILDKIAASSSRLTTDFLRNVISATIAL